METKNLSITIEFDKSPAEVYAGLRQAGKWWSKDFAGQSSELNDQFTIHHPGQHYSKHQVVEMVPDKKIAWLTTDSTLYWLQNQHEWTGTKMIFELTPEGNNTVLHFTHEGLTPGKECYTRCEAGWNMIIRQRLAAFINEGLWA